MLRIGFVACRKKTETGMARNKNKAKDHDHELCEGDSKILKRRVDKKTIDITYTINGQHRKKLKKKSLWT